MELVIPAMLKLLYLQITACDMYIVENFCLASNEQKCASKLF
jgi:hypothetical protein